MSAAKKPRSAAAFMAGMNRAQTAQSDEADVDREAADRSPPEVTGAWSIAGRRGLRDRFEEVEQEAIKANTIQHQGIVNGQIPIQIPVEKISDVVGTDRIVDRPDGDDADSFRSLVRNIQQRGQRVPIRVRPLDPTWKPHPATPRDITGQEFALQSGRRRLAACRELGIDVLCFLSFTEDEESARLEDLHERFYENAVRRDLTQIERLYSIGLIAQETHDASQTQIAEILGVNRSTVSRGIGVVEHYEALTGLIDLAKASRDEIDRALKQVRAVNPEERSQTSDAERARLRRQDSGKTQGPRLPFRRKETARGLLSLSRARTGKVVLKIETEDLQDETLAEILRVMESG